MSMTIPQGLYYFDDVVDEEYQMTLLNSLNNSIWKPVVISTKGRLVQHYGFAYDYETYNIYQRVDPIPEFMNKLLDTLYSKCNEIDIINETNKNYTFNQCIVNRYEPGQGISKHIDVKSYGGIIGCYTIGGGCNMTFRHKNGDTYTVYVKPGSLYIMSGDSRYLWTHEMKSVVKDKVNGKYIPRTHRISLTFRCVPLPS